jgi:hypothetical protein
MPLPSFGPNGLLPHDVHPTTRADLKARCVTEFPKSTTRRTIFAAFSRYQDSLARLGLNLTQWVDGSYVDQLRLDPEDVDVVNFGNSDNINKASAKHGSHEVGALLDGREETKAVYRTHSFLVLHFPAGHPMAEKYEARRQYWRDLWSQPQDYTGPVKKPALETRGRRGFVQMTVGNAKLSPAVSAAL